MKYFVLSAVLLLAITGYKMSVKPTVTEAEPVEEKAPKSLKKMRREKLPSGPTRLPASSSKGSTFVSREKSADAYGGQDLKTDDWNDQESTPQDSASAQVDSFGGAPMGSDVPYQRPGPQSPRGSSSNSSAKSSSSAAANGVLPGTMMMGRVPFGPTTPNNSVTTPTNTSTSAPSKKTPTPLTCQPSIGGGAFSHPIELSLSCSAAAEIQYCISEGTCCDPSSGQTYSLPIVVGQGPKTYCVSFIGTSNSTADSPVYQQTYSFSPDLPHLQVSYPKTHFQTTQLEASMLLASDNFGSAKYEMGLLNLRSHDPGPSGLDLNCEEIAETHASLTAPVPVYVLAHTNVSTQAVNSELMIGFTTPKLDYGVNFLTSFIQGITYQEHSYACSTQAVVLEDFEAFDTSGLGMSIPIGEAREFMGGFSSVGFFEEESQVPVRSPAGQNVETKDTQELRSGLLGIFFF